MRKNNRKFDQARNLSIVPNFQKNAIGSVLIKFEDTQVICSTNISNNIPRWLLNKNQGWITAEYNMLPNSSSERVSRDRGGKLSGRTQEIQRLIGRTLWQAVDLSLIPGIVITVDCDVLNADGGTRTASISGGFVALYLAISKLKKNYNIEKQIIKNFVAAISVGVIENKECVDLDYNEDSAAQVDANFVICDNGKISEIQATGEEYFFSEEQYANIFALAKISIEKIIAKQKKVLGLS